MLQLNVRLKYWRMPPPNRAIVIMRSAAHSLRVVVKSLFQRVRGRRAADTEASVGEEKTAEKALEEYRQILQNMFGRSEALDDAMENVVLWMNRS